MHNSSYTYSMPKFKCLCGHAEKDHNFDPDSSFFGCCAKFYTETSPGNDIVPSGVMMTHCKCDEFRADNLTYLEEAYAKHTNRKTR